MLTRFSVKNYRGFKDKIEWVLSKPSNYEFNTFAIKNGIVNKGIIYGPNGCGKSNFGYAIFDIINHLTTKEKLSFYYKNYEYAGNADGLVDFEYEFKFDKDVVEYSYSKNRDGILKKELLVINGKLLIDRNESNLFVDEQYKSNGLNVEAIINSQNNISVVGNLFTFYPLSETNVLMKMKRFVDSMLWFKNLEEDYYMGFESGNTNVEEYIITHSLHDDFAEFLKKVSGQNYEFLPSGENDKYLWCKVDDAKMMFDYLRSTGTRALEFLFYWINKIKNASFVFIDEFDAFYHFELTYKLCKVLFGFDCQVFLTSHNTYLMTNDLLRPDCNFIMDNNKIKSFVECTDKDLRWGHNIEKLYRGKAFTV